jgi:HK97 family phage major capsid protein
MSVLDSMREARTAKKAELDALLGAVQAREDKNFTADEVAKFDQLTAEIRGSDSRIDELEQIEQRENAAAETRRQAGSGAGSEGPGAQVTDPEVYIRSGKNGNSYFRDLGRATLKLDGAQEANERLQRHGKAQADIEKRALGNTNAAGGSGGEFAPPKWLVDDYIRLARMGRVTADLYNKMDVPSGTSSVNLPKVLTGTSVALQSSQNSNLSATDLTTGSVSTGFSTIGGKQIVSQQLLDQSAINFDQVVTSDLAAAYAQNLGSQIINGAGSGANNNSVVNGLLAATIAGANQSTFTSGSPTVALFYSKAAGMISSFVVTRLAQPEVWLMHPRRYYWLLAASDSNGRPLIVPQPVAFNPAATQSGSIVDAGATGMTFLGLPVYIDPQRPDQPWRRHQPGRGVPAQEV